MQTTDYKSQADKILSVIKKKGGRVTLQNIKRSVAEFNKKGGTERLREVLNQMIEHGLLHVDHDRAANNKEIESYRLRNSGSNADTIEHTINRNSNDMKIIGTHEFILEGVKDWIDGLIQKLSQEFAKSLIPYIATANGNNGNDCGNNRNALPIADTPKSNLPDYNEKPFDIPDSPNNTPNPNEQPKRPR